MTRIVIKICLSLLLYAALQVHAGVLHVSVCGSDWHPGTPKRPLRTIQQAAMLAQPGDTITVHAGVYRERINPPRGGVSDSVRIVYRAAPGAVVEIKGSEVVKGWQKVANNIWKVVLETEFFGEFNPFADKIHGDWFRDRGRTHHTAAVYLNGEWLTEANNLDELFLPDHQKPAWVTGNQKYINPHLWFAMVQGGVTTVWAQFPGVNPNEELTEVNVRQSVFYPDQPGRNYITVDGFIMRHAATPWAPPTAKQIGLIGTHWSKGWVISNCTISHSTCTGITLGKYGDERDNIAGTASGYVETIERALVYHIPWDKKHVGSHVVQNNHIHHCEQAGIVGSMGGAFSVIKNNRIHHIHVRQLFEGDEMSGIKLHGAINTLIQGNILYECLQGIWLDWMAQNARISGNLLYNNFRHDIYLEVNHGPLMVDNNIMLSDVALWDMSQGSAYAHNLFAGRMVAQPERARETPYHPNNETGIRGLTHISGGDNRFYNNIFIGNGTDGAGEMISHPSIRLNAPRHTPRGLGFGLWVYDEQDHPLQTGGNVYYHGARPWQGEANAAMFPETNPGLAFDEKSKSLTLDIDGLQEYTVSPLVTTDMLGKPLITNEHFVNPDGGFLVIDTDYLGSLRNGKNPVPGPFNHIEEGIFRLTFPFQTENQNSSAQ
jgi:alpha-L-arabinofuranosidase